VLPTSRSDVTNESLALVELTDSEHMVSPTVQRREEIIVERHAFEALVIYEVTGQELDQMDQETRGVGEDFSFALAGLSIGVTLATVLASVKIDAERTFNAFLIAMIISFVVTLYCGIKWFRARKAFQTVVQQIGHGFRGMKKSKPPASLPSGPHLVGKK
jgi:hypothetical protein